MISDNFQRARNMMVENQLRPNKISDQNILKLFNNIKKEDFLYGEIKQNSYNDLDINLISNRGYLKNLHIAQLINYAEINDKQKVLHVGGLTGYVSVILSNLSKELVVIENDKNLISQIEKNINILNIKNIKIVNCNFEEGYNDESPYDTIFIDNPLDIVPIKIKQQVNKNLGKIIMIKKYRNHLSKAYKIIRNNNIYTEEYLFDVFSKFELFEKNKEFIF